MLRGAMVFSNSSQCVAELYVHCTLWCEAGVYVKSLRSVFCRWGVCRFTAPWRLHLGRREEATKKLMLIEK